MAAEKDAIDWHALALAERAHYQHARDAQWKIHLGLWAILTLALYAVYATEVVEPIDCWACWALYACMVAHLLWCIAYQRDLEESLARWSYYQGYADDAFTAEHMPSLLQPRVILAIATPVVVTSGLCWLLCVLLRNPPLH